MKLVTTAGQRQAYRMTSSSRRSAGALPRVAVPIDFSGLDAQWLVSIEPPVEGEAENEIVRIVLDVEGTRVALAGGPGSPVGQITVREFRALASAIAEAVRKLDPPTQAA